MIFFSIGYFFFIVGIGLVFFIDRKESSRSRFRVNGGFRVGVEGDEGFSVVVEDIFAVRGLLLGGSFGWIFKLGFLFFVVGVIVLVGDVEVWKCFFITEFVFWRLSRGCR